MRFLNKFLKSIVCLTLILFVLTSLNVSSSLADDCGKKDRVAVPRCMTVGELGRPGKEYINAINHCSEDVVLKFDKPGKDIRIRVPAGGYETASTNLTESKISCCPRYSRCVF